MKRTLIRALVIAAITAGGAAVAVTPAQANPLPGPVCILNQNTWQRWEPWGIVMHTLTAGHGFRVHGGSSNGYETWYYGHGAEFPNDDGWIPATNCNF